MSEGGRDPTSASRQWFPVITPESLLRQLETVPPSPRTPRARFLVRKSLQVFSSTQSLPAPSGFSTGLPDLDCPNLRRKSSTSTRFLPVSRRSKSVYCSNLNYHNVIKVFILPHSQSHTVKFSVQCSLRVSKYVTYYIVKYNSPSHRHHTE